jgi:hypothetical protein
MPEQLPVDIPSGSRPEPRPDPGSGVTPASLWEAVLTARAALVHERNLHRRPTELTTARAVLLQALEAYVRSLEERSHPIPYALRDDLRLQRLTCAPNGHARRLTTSKEPAHGHSVR